MRAGRALERAANLLQVIVVVGGVARHPLPERQPPAPGMHAAALPLCRGEGAQQSEDVAAAPAERGERQRRILARILSVVGPAVGVERMPDPRTHTPWRELLGGGAQTKIAGSSAPRIV